MQYLGEWVLSPFGLAVFGAYLVPWAVLLALPYPPASWVWQAWLRYARSKAKAVEG